MMELKNFFFSMNVRSIIVSSFSCIQERDGGSRRGRIIFRWTVARWQPSHGHEAEHFKNLRPQMLLAFSAAH